MSVITDKDQRRIEEARRINPIDWGTVNKWAEEADTEDAREELAFIGKCKERAEEYSAGLL